MRVAHVIFRFGCGGLENGLVNLINRLPEEDYRHSIICLTEYTDFRRRITRNNVSYFQLHKKPGKDPAMYWRLWRLLRELKPDIVHTRNIGTIDCALVAFLAGVKVRIHGEHGRDMLDIDGTNRKYILLRRLLARFIDCFVALSRDLESWLRQTVRIPDERIRQIYNGVDLSRFRPAKASGARNTALADIDAGTLVLGTVGRLSAEKGQEYLIEAMAHLRREHADAAASIRLFIIGDGPLRGELEQRVREAGLAEVVSLIGARDDIPEIYRQLSIFVLPSLGEGISNTILEAMASGLPVIATRVGGNPELVVDGETGFLVEPASPVRLADAIARYARDPARMRAHAEAGRKRVGECFSMDNMVRQYDELYRCLLTAS